ncbi:hypothetical protein BXZ70DRAFT_1025238 [Cristinia sonorae]|uniref:GATA-type domain-containing protein n=1 Tax=Cristinia sonorae TaxID=1940300 RepID=A0A8K0UNT0_9AGAR|nr:hypothetical protein BXZ70DRAFT_1025238 [Cristinia sonorae]
MSLSDSSFQPLAQADFAAHLSTLPMNALPAFDNPPSHSMHPTNGSHSSLYPDHPPPPLPKVGETRCCEFISPPLTNDRSSIVNIRFYISTEPSELTSPPDWSLLSPDLRFLYVDPVLASHLAEQADDILGKTLLTYVHPDEQASAKHDLGSVLESRTLHGSVTRVRFSRLSRVRRLLGYQGHPEPWADAPKISLDANYMAVDIVINWAADGLVLCFIHAVVDLQERDNDEQHKTGWTNWCGTPYMGVDQVHLLYSQLVSKVPQPPSMNRVFQILLNQPDRALWMSWPPDPPQGQQPSSKNFARLAEDVQIGSSAASSTDAKTSCTRRYKALQTMQLQDCSQEVESIFIPYGSIIFACHRVNSYSKPLTNGSANIPQHSQPYNSYNSQSYYEPSVHQSYSHPPVAPPHYSNGNSYASPSSMSQPPPPPHPHYPWSEQGPPPTGHYNQWGPTPPMGPSPNNSMRSSYPPPPPQQQQPWSSQPPYIDGSPYSYPPPQGMPYQGHSQGSTPVGGGGPPSPGSDVVPASRIPRRGALRDSYTNGGRSTGNPPVGVNKCASCKVTHSPEWRKGPSGKKDLCNACGLRYARSRAKKEGGAQRRRKEQRVMSGMSDRGHSPSGSPVGGMSYTGNDAFSHREHNSPSPSPPGPGFIPYSHHVSAHHTSPHHPSQQPQHAPPPHSSSSSHHDHYSHNDHRYAPPPPQQSYYSVPPPPPGPSSYPPSTSHPVHSSYNTGRGGRMSPSEADSNSPLSTSFQPASFEREKHERDLDGGLDVGGSMSRRSHGNGNERGRGLPSSITPDPTDGRQNGGGKYHYSS